MAAAMRKSLTNNIPRVSLDLPSEISGRNRRQRGLLVQHSGEVVDGRRIDVFDVVLLLQLIDAARELWAGVHSHSEQLGHGSGRCGRSRH